MLRNIHIGVCTLLAIALGCSESYKPDVSTETGNPPVTIDSAKIALVVSRDEVHVRGEAGAIMPPEADVEITIVRTRDATLTSVEDDGSFDIEVDATLNDVFEVRAILGEHESDVVIVVRGASEVIEGDGGGLSCEQHTNLGAAILDAAHAMADRSCETAADCSHVYRSASCLGGCLAGYYSEEGQRTIADAIEAVDEGVCASFMDDGCPLVLPDCFPPEPAACVEGQCVEAESQPNGCQDACLASDLSWRVTSAGILPGLPNPSGFKLSGCDTLEITGFQGERCTSTVPQCEAEGDGVTMAAVVALLGDDDVVQAFEAGGTIGYPEDMAGYTYQLSLGEQMLTYRSCAGGGAGVLCEPSLFEELVELLDRLPAENNCVMPNVDCDSDFEIGDCDAAFSRWWHDPRTGACLLRTYGGCGGNENNYVSEAACRAACPPRSSESACPPNRVFAEDVCFECGPVGPCLEPTNACLLVCSEDAHCEGEDLSWSTATVCTDAGVCGPRLMCL